MSKSATFADDLLALIFNATPIANIADDASSSPLASLYIALHTADPGEGGTMATSECAYTGYARMAVDRSSDEWLVENGRATPVNNIVFPAVTGGNEIARYFSVGVGATAGGADKILYSGALENEIAISSGVIPQLTTATSISED
ncbi:hypothetical protein L0F51_00305 [Afifella sp. H1R]|uniref:phage tail fiber protein n=1 Tax=Afifella sp. H1R TaxID=2908841 RepID=UPI001F3285E2|nr:hypothetical protein [Afifella sp. H1R]MCF1502206.1 hypothetical protein [Afifella sp. H1R]